MYFCGSTESPRAFSASSGLPASIVSEMKWTEPSTNTTFTPPGWVAGCGDHGIALARFAASRSVRRKNGMPLRVDRMGVRPSPAHQPASRLDTAGELTVGDHVEAAPRGIARSKRPAPCPTPR